MFSELECPTYISAAEGKEFYEAFRVLVVMGWIGFYDVNVDSEFFHNFPVQACDCTFSGFDFSTRELPFPGQWHGWATARSEYAAFVFDQGTGDLKHRVESENYPNNSSRFSSATELTMISGL